MGKLSLSALFLAAGLVTASAQEGSPTSAPPAADLNATEQQHPDWFRETYTYRPCPADVVFQDGTHACLGRHN